MTISAVCPFGSRGAGKARTMRNRRHFINTHAQTVQRARNQRKESRELHCETTRDPDDSERACAQMKAATNAQVRVSFGSSRACAVIQFGF
ncbi:hypothetical protein NDU88_001584 [Pleurodeles waltl]|uniref:Uncharacterized protein n=1 Tax=Pleurodeles waltl TaxID=8319 RepID=A0AAV7TI65_PLEWA|nr:hypothetical protein NDU88_001584 [Pleurodeles waltl]